jgi:hypothetical protein
LGRKEADHGAAFGLQPHRSQTFKLSSDPLFVDQVRDIVGLYLGILCLLVGRLLFVFNVVPWRA